MINLISVFCVYTKLETVSDHTFCNRRWLLPWKSITTYRYFCTFYLCYKSTFFRCIIACHKSCRTFHCNRMIIRHWYFLILTLCHCLSRRLWQSYYHSIHWNIPLHCHLSQVFEYLIELLHWLPFEILWLIVIHII